VLEGGDTGQSEPATVLQVSTAGYWPAWKIVKDAAGNGEQTCTLLGI
jgi:hypothetical protein